MVSGQRWILKELKTTWSTDVQHEQFVTILQRPVLT